MQIMHYWNEDNINTFIRQYSLVFFRVWSEEVTLWIICILAQQSVTALGLNDEFNDSNVLY